MTATRSMFPFGSGRMFLQGTGDLAYFRVGVAAMQEGGWNIDVDVKELHGDQRFPVDVRTGMGKIEGTAKFTDWDADTIARMLGVSTATGVNVVAVNVAGTIPASAAFTLTPSVPSPGVWVKNLEVVTTATGVPLHQCDGVIEVLADGKFTVAAGVYTFHSAQGGVAVLISFVYSLTAGKHVAWSNVAIGTTPVMSGIFQNLSDDKQMVLELYSVVPHGIKWGTRIDDWAHQDISLKAFANPANGTIGRINIYTG